MPHQNTSSPQATDQNAATPSGAPNDRAVEQNASVRPEPRTYAAPDVADATLAPPAAGEMSDYADDGDDLGGAAVQQGGDRGDRPRKTEADFGQGPKTLAANRRLARGGGSDQGAQ